MKLIKFYIIVLSAVFIFLACGKKNETATAEQNTKSQISEANSKPANVRDENGWYNNWDAGMEAAKIEKKPVLVDFYADWCEWCHEMDEKTFSTPEIKKIFASGWITIRLDTEDDKTEGILNGEKIVYKQIAGKFGITVLPSYLFIDKEGKPVTIILGYRPKEPFSIILDYFQNELYKKEINLNEYIESKS